MGLGQAENNPTEIPLTTRGKQDAFLGQLRVKVQ
jgi:hypothetical protein